MSGLGDSQQTMTLRDYVGVVRRHIWMVAAAIVVVTVAAVGYSLHQKPLYQASASLLLGSPTNTDPTGTANQSPTNTCLQTVSTQASFARSQKIAERTIAKSGVTGRSANQLLRESSVAQPPTGACVLSFTVTDRSAAVAATLARTYAQQFGAFQKELDNQSFETAINHLQQRIDELGTTQPALRRSLEQQQQSIKTAEVLQQTNAFLISSSKGVKVSPKPVRDGILGLVLGIILGFGLAFIREALDTRVRSADEITARLPGFPLLGRVPAPPKRLAESGHLAMLDEPSGPHAETYRMLRTNLDLASLDRDVKTLMITSAVEKEGKSTTIANLAVALARAGKRVALVDLDLRRPILAKLFGLDGPGVTQVALGKLPLEEAIVPIAIVGTAGAPTTLSDASGNGRKAHRGLQGLLEVLPSGPIPPDPGEFVGSQALEEILEGLRERADIVLIDTPPVLQVGDATALSSKVDAVLVATRLKLLRRAMLHALARQLTAIPAHVLGFVVTGANEEQGYGYGYGYGYRYGYTYGQSSNGSGRFKIGARASDEPTDALYEGAEEARAGRES